MATELGIDFVSDIACPWCAIGLAGLEEALRRTQGEVQARIRFQPFELNPAMAREGVNLEEHLGRHYGGGPAQMAAMREQVRARAASVGLVFNQDRTSRIYNTFDAHRLLHWARDSGHQAALKRALFEANFTDNANLADHEVLGAVAARAGLDPDAAREVLASGRYGDVVREAQQQWLSRGIQSVPAIVINGKWLISGGQPPEAFEQALRQIAAGPAAQEP